MATKIIFQGSTRTGVDSELQCHANTWDEIFIQIQMKDHPDSWITLDRETAIKLSKVLKSEISKIPY